MSRLEAELREVFAAKTGEMPPLRDPIDLVIRRARTVRRRRRVALAASLVLALTFSLLTGFGIGHDWSMPPASRNPILNNVERIVDGVLITPTGTRVDLGEDQVSWAARIPYGLVYLDDTAALRLLHEPGPSRTLLTYLEDNAPPLVSQNGLIVAGAGPGGKIWVSTLRRGQVFSTRAEVYGGGSKADKTPLGWYGDRLLFAETSGERGPRHWDWSIVKPDESAREIRLPERIEILGAILKGRWFLGVSRVGEQSCLVRLDPAQGYTVVADLCALAPDLDQTAFSTQGSYLSVSTPDSLRIYDLQTLFDSPRPRAIEGCPPSSKVTWIDDRRLASGNVVCRIERRGKITTARLPAPPKGAKVVYVTRYGV